MLTRLCLVFFLGISFSGVLSAIQADPLEEKDVVWYVHLQLEFVPYDAALSADIEKSYQKYKRGRCPSRSMPFRINGKSYVIDFDNFVQTREDSRYNYIYRYVRRIGFNRRLTDAERNFKIPLVLEELNDLAGHSYQKCSPDELESLRQRRESREWANFRALIVSDSYVLEEPAPIAVKVKPCRKM